MLRVIFSVLFFVNNTASTEIYTSLHTLSLPDDLPITASSWLPVVSLGKRARASAMCPFSTSVKRRRISALGSPKAIVRVTSVVTSGYWPPESRRNSSHWQSAQLLAATPRSCTLVPLGQIGRTAGREG